MYFKQIIFPSKPRVTTTSIPNQYEFSCWILGSPVGKVMWVKCPVCEHTYELMDVCNESIMRNNLREYEPFYFEKIIRKCPYISIHPEKLCQPISNR
jgi:hypothetical protein